MPFVVLDFSPEAIERAREHSVLFIEGSGTEDEDLEAAGLERARGLSRRPTRTRTTSTSRSRRARARPDLLIVARASDEDAARKLRLAGADRVVQPYSTAGKEMAKLVAEAAGGGVPRHRLDAAAARISASRRSRSRERAAQAGKSIRELRVRARRPAR